MIPTLPIIGPPQGSLFILLEAVPDGAFLILLTVIGIVAMIAPWYPWCSAILPEELGETLHKYVSYCFKLPVYVFPKLFSKKKVRLESEEDSEEILYLDQRLQLSFKRKDRQSQCAIILFTTLAVIVCCTTALGFFRYFPISISLECLEEDDNFNTLFCYKNAEGWHLWDLPLDCEEYQKMNKSDRIVNMNDPNSNSFESDVICYAFSVDLGKSAAVAIGIYNFLSLLIFATVTIGNIWVRVWLYCAHGKCRCKASSTKICSAICYGLICFFAFFTSGIFSILILDAKPGLKNAGIGELYYRLAYCIGFFVCAVYFLYIPLYTRHYIDGEDTDSYSYLATSDKQMRRFQTNTNGASTYETT